jgi:hypothetical protein
VAAFKGVTAVKPLHELRKEFGSQLCAKYGTYAASRMLRLADIAITAQHYLDQKERVTFGMGSASDAGKRGANAAERWDNCAGASKTFQPLRQVREMP